MSHYRPHRFPPLSQVTLNASSPAQLQLALADGFQQGLEKGYREGYDSGLQEARAAGLAQGREQGLREGRDEGMQAVRTHVEQLLQPVDALLDGLRHAQADYQSALRKEVVDLVGKVARQVIRCELALQPVQLLALVDETLATMPPAREGVEVFLNPEELERIRELDPARAARWKLIADPRLEPGECRVKADGREADAGCRQRLAACMERVGAQLLPATEPHDEVSA